ncbi:enoyl-CoA hydratase [Halogeometricum borinquense DSM 11551]|uniref:Enoyl-CoA hydratase n=2 Tax=Halogeometricum borinquense TaxID=60847 RepID=E4NLZ0_HALBP|nr:enoyl-CoA hydratase/isomerase family protein [Halogeometricum borinquense]ADQ66089.1 enoyl-CoA hydratase/carnithine racemase [Halogeometricum borinquense DSM 11551]ELY27415.1 enoyl-CoA hydratase [Halogeometricum borinquense DSM 11551]RYJ13744.1 enoyl-CoA hydratase/isomerase family protein [Halogeometricum borinquense]
MIRTTADGPVRVVTIDRPERRNALRPTDLDELAAAVTDADSNETPVIYLRGAGGHFCAGADLDSVSELADPEAFAQKGQQVANTIADASAVVVAGIDGAARGGGVEMALACDVRVATPDATFAEPGVEFGLFGAWGGTVRLPRIVGEGEAMDIALSGRVVDAAEARRIGLVSRVVEDPRTVADEIASNRSDALRVVKRRLRDDADDKARERAEAEAFARLHERYVGDIRQTRGERGGDDSE